MRFLVLSVLCAVLTWVEAEEFKKFDTAAVKRFDNELRRLGIVLPSLSTPDEPINPPDPTVSSAAGDFEGYWTKSQFGRPIAAFEGIPYAQPPVGSLRFKVAQPLTTRLSNFPAKKPGAMCTQKTMSERNPKIIGNEDCLYLNIYVPERTERKPSELLPVMFWVHGGYFIFDAGHTFKSDILMDKDVILVTINYRLGALGFLTTEDEVIPGNIGLKDQVAALRWVHQNIAAFGGDTSLLTVFGESAGGASVEYLMLSPLTKGIIHRVISMSASVLAPWAVAPRGEMRRHVRKAAEHLVCPDEPSQALLECLLTKTAEELIAVAALFPVWKQKLVCPFKPVIEGDIPGAHIPKHPAQLFAEGPVNDVPYMTGILSEEGSLFTPGIFRNADTIKELDKDFWMHWPNMLGLTKSRQRSPKTIGTIRRAYITPGSFSKSNLLQMANIFTDVLFLWPTIHSRQYKNKSKAPSYFYYLNYEPSRSFVPQRGIVHGDDLLLLFNYTGFRFDPPSPTDVMMSMIWTDLFTSFARDGVPSSKLMKTPWLPITTDGFDIEYLDVKSPINVTMKKGLLPERWTLLKTLFESVE